MEVDGVRLWFDQALYKQPGGHLTDYHQDAGLWPVGPTGEDNHDLDGASRRAP